MFASIRNKEVYTEHPISWCNTVLQKKHKQADKSFSKMWQGASKTGHTDTTSNLIPTSFIAQCSSANLKPLSRYRVQKGVRWGLLVEFLYAQSCLHSAISTICLCGFWHCYPYPSMLLEDAFICTSHVLPGNAGISMMIINSTCTLQLSLHKNIIMYIPCHEEKSPLLFPSVLLHMMKY